MDVVPTVVANAEAAESVQPCDGPLDDPAKPAESTAVAMIATRDEGEDPVAAQLLAMSRGVVGAIGEDRGRSATAMAAMVFERRNARDQRQELGDVVGIGTGDDGRERYAAAVGHQMMLGARARAIGGIRARFFPAPIARTDEESTTARDQSMRNASARSCRSK